MAATPQAERRAARVPISSARRRQSSSSALLVIIPNSFLNKFAVSDKFSNGSSSIRDRNDESRVYALRSLLISCP